MSLKRSMLPLVAAVAFAFAGEAHAATCNFSAVATNWNADASWDCGHVPTSADSAVLGSGDNAHVTAAPPAVGHLTIDSGTLTFDADVNLAVSAATLDGRLLAGNASITGAGTLTLAGGLSRTAADNQLLLTGGADVVVDGASTLDHGYICINSAGSTLQVNAVFTIADGANQNAFNCGAGTIIVGPGGELRSTRAGSAQVQTELDNDGLVSAAAGSLLINGSGPNTDAGTFRALDNAGTPATLVLNHSRTLAATGVITSTGNGTIAVNGGTVTLPSGAALTPTRLTQNGGTLVLEGTAGVTLPLYTVTSGILNSTRDVTATAFTAGNATLTGAFDLTVPSGGSFARSVGDNQLQITGGANLILNTASSTLDQGYICLNNADSTLQINAVFTIADGANQNAFNCGAGTIIVGPSGELRSTRAGSAQVQAQLDNDGLVSAVAGTLQLNGMGPNTDAGTFRALDNAGTPATLVLAHSRTLAETGVLTSTGNGTVAVNGGTVTLPTGAALTPTRLTQNGGTLVLEGTAAVTLPLYTVTSGILNSTRDVTATSFTAGNATLTGAFDLTVPNGGSFARSAGDNQLQITGGADLILNAASSTLDHGYICINSADSTLQVNAVFTIADGANQNAFNCGAGTIVVSSTGELRSTRAGSAQIQAQLDNDGLVSAVAGLLQLNGSGPNTDAGTFRALDNAGTPATLVLNHSRTLAATGVITSTGNGTVAVNGGTVTLPSGAALTPTRLTQNGGTLVLEGTAAVSLPVYTVTSGILNSTRDVTATAFTAGNATLTGAFDLTVPSGGSFARSVGDNQLQITGGANLILDAASSTLDQGYICLNSADSRLQVNALFTIADGANPNAFNCGAGTIVVGPGGELRSTRAGSAQVQAQLDNDGLVSAVAGTLQLNGVGRNTDAGTFRALDNAGTPATLVLNHSRTLAGTGVITGTGNGTVAVNGGTLTLPAGAQLTPARLTQNGGTLVLEGTAAVTLPLYTVTSGTLDSTRNVTATSFTAGNAALTGAFDLTVPNGGSFARSVGDNQLLITGGAELILSSASSTLDQGYICLNHATSALRINALFTIANGANPNAFNCGAGTIVVGPGGELRSTRDTGATAVQAPVSIAGGQLTVPAGITLNLNSGLSQSAGTTTVQGTLGGTTTLAGGVLQGTGRTGNVNHTGGTVRPGTSPGTLTIDGNYVQSAGATLDVEIAGTAAGQFDVLDVNGDAVLNGTVRHILLNAFAPASTDTFRFLTSDTQATGTPTVTGDPVPGGLTFSVVKPSSAPFGAALVLAAPAAPVNQTRPSITGSGTLTCTPGTWTGTPALTYQWLRDGVVIASGAQYTVVAADAAHQLVCRETATNLGGTASADSDPRAIPAIAPQNTAAPSVTGSPESGLACDPGTFSGAPAPTVTIEWLRDGTPIAGATGTTYKPTAADAGHRIACRVTATNSGGSDSETSAEVAVPAPPAPPTPTPTPAPAPTPAPTPPSPTAVAEQQLAAAPPSQVAGAFGLPSTRRCVSRRRFSITLFAPRNVRIRKAQVFLNGKRLKVRRSGARHKATIDLRGLPKGTFRVRIRITTGTGRRLTGERRYRTCRPR